MAEQPLRRVYLPNLLEKLAALIIEQGEEAIRHSDVELPPRVTATFIYIGKHGPVSAADIAKSFNQPHQLVTQRIELLESRGLVARVADAKDARRKLLKLTPKGKAQLQLLWARLAEAEKIYAELFDEIDCDLTAKVAETIAALERRPFLERGRAYAERNRKRTPQKGKP